MEACVEGGAHHVDISGEPQYLEKMVTGVSPYTHADNIPDQVRLVATTILAVTLNAKVLNDTKLISSIVEILLKSLKIDKL